MIIKSASDWLSNIWIIHKDVGVCIFEQNFRNIDTDSDLITGFIVAMLNFGKEIADKDLQSINFAGLKIMLSIHSHFIIALAIDENAPEPDLKMFLSLVGDEFEKRYGDCLINWNGNVDIFTDFASYIEEIVDKKAIAIDFLKNHIVKKIKESDESKFIIEKLKKLDSILEVKQNEYLNDSKNLSKTSGIQNKVKKETFKHIFATWKKLKELNPFDIF
ncbi:MAG: hypothetical protein ACTSRZ_15750 [Promethearchaeota archaeon]